MEMHLIKDLSEIEKLKSEWDISTLKDYGNILGVDGTMSPEWTRLILKELIRPDDIRFIKAVDRNQEGAVLPMVRTYLNVFCFKLKTLTSVYQFYSGRTGIMAKNPQLFDFKTLFKILSFNGYAWNMMCIKCVDGSASQKYMEKGLKASGAMFSKEVESQSPYVTLDTDWNTYLKSKSSKFRKRLKYYQNKLKKIGEKNLVEYKYGKKSKIFFGHIMEIEEDSWKEIEGTSIPRNPTQYRFYHRLFNDNNCVNLLRGYVLYIDQEPVAYNFGLLFNNIYCCLKMSFKKSYDQYSPGHVLTAEIIEAMCSSGVAYFDFMGVFDAGKRRFTENSYSHVWYEIYQKNPIGMLLYFKHWITVFLKKKLLPAISGETR